MKQISIAAVLVTLVAWTATPLAQSPAAPSGAPTLYQRVGGYDGVVSFVGLVFPRVVEHPDLTHMFRGHGKDSQQRQFQMVVELICQRAGGPCAYTGRPMPQVHDGLGITDAQWATFMTIIERGLDEKKYPADVRAPFLQIWREFKPGVVQR